MGTDALALFTRPLITLISAAALGGVALSAPAQAAEVTPHDGTTGAARPAAATHQHARSGYSPALTAIHAPRVWKRTKGHGITVAVIDSGVAGDVTNLRGQVLPGVDMVEPHRADGWNDAMPAGGHGTGVASVIAGSGRSIPVHGIAPRVTVLPVRIANAHGTCPDARVAKGIVWATRHGADVINLSIGTTAEDISRRDLRLEHAAVRYAVRHGVTVVAGAGNNGPDHTGRFYPAAFPEVIAVGGANMSGTAAASFSNRGEWVDVVAPAMEVWNANTDGSLGTASGTSFASPAVAAMAALMLAVDPHLSPTAIRRMVMASASDLGPRGVDRDTGAGLVDAAGAVSAAVRTARSR